MSSLLMGLIQGAFRKKHGDVEWVLEYKNMDIQEVSATSHKNRRRKVKQLTWRNCFENSAEFTGCDEAFRNMDI